MFMWNEEYSELSSATWWWWYMFYLWDSVGYYNVMAVVVEREQNWRIKLLQTCNQISNKQKIKAFIFSVVMVMLLLSKNKIALYMLPSKFTCKWRNFNLVFSPFHSFYLKLKRNLFFFPLFIMQKIYRSSCYVIGYELCHFYFRNVIS